MEKRSFSNNAMLNRTKIHPREMLNYVHTEVLKPHNIVLEQEVSKLAGRLEFHDNCCSGFS